MKAGSDVAKTAVSATDGAVMSVAKAGTDISAATRSAVTGAIEPGDEIGTHASKAVRDGIADRLHDGRRHSCPAGHRHRCGADPGYSGTKTSVTIFDSQQATHERR